MIGNVKGDDACKVGWIIFMICEEVINECGSGGCDSGGLGDFRIDGVGVINVQEFICGRVGVMFDEI